MDGRPALSMDGRPCGWTNGSVDEHADDLNGQERLVDRDGRTN